jgi:hypothetical protein
MIAPLKSKPCFTEAELSKAMPMFYVVGKNKLVIMLCMTFGYYLIYWNYRNWKAYRMAVGAAIWPVGRTVLGIFFLYSLFMKIDRQLRISKRHYNWHPHNLMVGVIVAAGISTYLCIVGVDPKAVFPIALAFLIFQSFLLLRAQTAINHLEEDPEGHQNAKLTLSNYAWIAVGSIIWFFVICGTLMLA